MRLITLSANKESFHTINFREKGVSLILAKQKNPQESDKGKTTNGVGKSLIVTLLHFCLGSNENEKLARSIPDWEFILAFELEGVRHTAARKVQKQDEIILDGNAINITKYREFLQQGTFTIPDGVSHVSFRSLIKRFLRPNKEAYTAFDCIEAVDPPIARLLNMSLLLGLDVKLVHEKYRLKKQKDKVEVQLASLEKDSIFKTFLTKDKDVDNELLDLDDKIRKLDSDLAQFKVAEDYHDIENKANSARRRLESINNRGVIIQNAIEHVQSSLNIAPDLALDKINKTYEEAGIRFPSLVQKSLQEVTDFHAQLIVTRKKRLEEELAKLLDQSRKIGVERKTVGEELDAHLQYLGAHSALEVYLQLTKSVADHKAQANKLREYKKLVETYRTETQTLKAALAQETIKAETYLQSNDTQIKGNLAVFRSFAKRFYPDVPSGLSVVNNDGDNQVRFEIVAKIQSDASDGINEVKIFCFDLTALRLGLSNKVKFLLHDSRLFSDVDARQTTTLFTVLAEEIAPMNLQYVATINEDHVNAIRQYLSPEDFNVMITKNVILTLTDENAAAKLLGIQVDIE